MNFYFEVEDVYGVIASIENSEPTSSVKLSGEEYNIEITNEQKRRIAKHLKKDRLLVCVRKKINSRTEKTESAVLIDFEVVGGDGEELFDKAEKLKAAYRKRGLFPKVKDASLSVRKLRGELNPFNTRRMEGRCPLFIEIPENKYCAPF